MLKETFHLHLSILCISVPIRPICPESPRLTVSEIMYGSLNQKDHRSDLSKDIKNSYEIVKEKNNIQKHCRSTEKKTKNILATEQIALSD